MSHHPEGAVPGRGHRPAHAEARRGRPDRHLLTRRTAGSARSPRACGAPRASSAPGWSRSATSTCSSTPAATSTSSPRPRSIALVRRRRSSATTPLHRRHRDAGDRRAADRGGAGAVAAAVPAGRRRAAGAGRAARTTRRWCSTRSCCGRWRWPAGRRRCGDCARCGQPGPHRALLRAGRRRGVPGLPADRVGHAPTPATIALLDALLAGDWDAAEASRAGPPPGGQRPGRGATCSGTWSAGCARCRWSTGREAARSRPRRPPHPSGARPPDLPRDKVPRHVAIVMDGNGRWAKERGLPRTEGHKAGEARAVRRASRAPSSSASGPISAYAFSTENWRRSPEEVRFLMGFNRDVIRRRRDEMHALGVRVRWAGRRPRLWRSVIKRAGGRRGADPRQRRPDPDHVRQLRRPGRDRRRRRGDRPRGRRRPARPGEGRRATVARYLDEPDMPDVDLFLRTSGEQRTATSCSGSPPTPSWSSSTRCGPTSTAGTCGRPARCTPPGSAASAAPEAGRRRERPPAPGARAASGSHARPPAPPRAGPPAPVAAATAPGRAGTVRARRSGDARQPSDRLRPATRGGRGGPAAGRGRWPAPAGRSRLRAARRGGRARCAWQLADRPADPGAWAGVIAGPTVRRARLRRAAVERRRVPPPAAAAEVRTGRRRARRGSVADATRRPSSGAAVLRRRSCDGTGGRRRCAARGASPTRASPWSRSGCSRPTPPSPRSTSGSDRDAPGAGLDLKRQSAQVPKISSVWLTSAKPCSPATRSAQASTAGPATSTVRPHDRHTRWWWCWRLHRRYSASPEPVRMESSSPSSASDCTAR